ncbi:MAG TPA: hypothetical protein VL832_00100 [Puia sp.]|nr:hypothetical protein [Puia sp.]
MEDEPEHPIRIRIAVAADVKYVYPILEEMERSARARGTGIARRSPQSLCQKIYEGKAVIAVAAKEAGNGIAGNGIAGNVANGAPDEEWVGFSYIETWGGGSFVSNSGLIVNPVYRGVGVAKAIKQEIFALSRRRYPGASIFSITTGAAVMKLNHQLGFEPVTYGEITRDATFWDQCRHCVNYSILESKQRQLCLCTAMLFTPERTDRPVSGAVRPEEKVAGKVEFSI